MNGAEVGKWPKESAGTGATLVGSLLTGNVPGAVAAGVALHEWAMYFVVPPRGLVSPVRALEQP